MKEYKETTTIYISERLRKQAKSLNINLSQAMEKVLQVMIEMNGKSEEEVELATLIMLRDRYQLDLERMEGNLVPFKARVEAYNQRIEKQTKMVDEIKRSEGIAQLIKILNGKIKEAEYNMEKVKEIAKDEIAKLSEINSEVNEEWLRRQIERVARFDRSL